MHTSVYLIGDFKGDKNYTPTLAHSSILFFDQAKDNLTELGMYRQGVKQNMNHASRCFDMYSRTIWDMLGHNNTLSQGVDQYIDDVYKQVNAVVENNIREDIKREQ